MSTVKVTDASFDGAFLVASVSAPFAFTYSQAGPDTTSGGGTAPGLAFVTGAAFVADGGQTAKTGSPSFIPD